MTDGYNINRLNWDLVEKNVNLIQESHKCKTKSVAFLVLLLKQYFYDVDDIIEELITDGPGDCGVDAIHIVESNQSVDIFIFVAKYRSEYKHTNRSINETEVLRVTKFLEMLFNKSAELNKESNGLLKEILKRIYAIYENGAIFNYHVIFCSNDNGMSPSAHNFIESYCRQNNNVQPPK